MLSRRLFASVAALSAAIFLAGTAAAIEFSLPSLDTRLHTLTSGQPGAEWNTGGLGSNGNLSYSSTTESITLSGELDVLNYYDPNVGGCPTDVGSNCAYNFTNNPTFDVLADLVDITVTDFGGGFYGIDIQFQSTGGSDIVLTDDDSTVLLTASWQSGSFQGNPTTGLTVSALYNAGTLSLVGDPTAVGFASITGGSYAQLFDSGGSTDISLHLAEFFDFSPTTSAIAAALVANYISNGGTGVDNSALVDFTAEGQGQIFRVASGDFVVPEPGSLLLLGSALALAVLRRRD